MAGNQLPVTRLLAKNLKLKHFIQTQIGKPRNYVCFFKNNCPFINRLKPCNPTSRDAQTFSQKQFLKENDVKRKINIFMNNTKMVKIDICLSVRIFFFYNCSPIKNICKRLFSLKSILFLLPLSQKKKTHTHVYIYIHQLNTTPQMFKIYM